ncbi:MAG TPA: hypothetical protein VFY98_00485 [Intrasporangium sp.]|nr:hypothetical protein [Intrasporangium sp.]
MFMHKAARIAAVLTAFVVTVFVSGRAALAVNLPPPGGGEPPAPLPPMDPIASPGPNWAVLLGVAAALVVVAALVALYRSGVRPRAVRHA